MAYLDKGNLGLEEQLFMSVIKLAMAECANQFGLSPITALAVMGVIIGRQAACIDESMKDNEEVRNKLLVPHADYDHMLTGADTHECFIANYNYAREQHIKHHVERRAAGEAVSVDLLNAVCESHKGEKK